MEFFDHFGAVRIVNLVTRPDRRRETVRELAKFGVNAGAGKVQWFNAVKPQTAEGFPSEGVRGCFLSHLSVLREARDAKLPSVLVLEDDFQANPGFASSAKTILDSLRSQEWGFAYFGYELPEGPSYEVAQQAVPKLVRHTRAVQLTSFYAVNGPVLPRVVAYLESCLTRPPGDPIGGPMHVDGAFSMFRGANPDVITLVCVPALGTQRPSRTDLHPLRWFDRVPIVRALFGLLRTVRARFHP